MSVVIGKTDQNKQLAIGDIERRNGLYILGKPRMGKSWLLINMILQDIENGHGVFFIDPHGDAIDEIMNRRLMLDNIYLDPEDADCSFGINILACPDIANHELRSDTFARAKGFFDKIWKNTFEERPWLQLILQNALYAFIENQGYTLAELPLFFRDSAFRAFICSNIKYNVTVRDYWLKTFAAKDKRDQDAQLEAAQTRLEILLAHPAIRHIVGQSKTTINFSDIFNQGKSVFLKFSSAMAIEVKKIIGTLVVSELLSAIQKRPANKRNLFCIYIDEFQNFASFEDFAVLITQAPKYGISTTLAHHERYGQLSDDQAIAGATSAIVNKVIFQTTGRDARDLAPEFAEKSPIELKTEEALSLSQNPVRDLLNGHFNPDVRALVDKSIRLIKQRLDILKGEIEGKKVIRMQNYDETSILRIDELIAIDHERYGQTRRSPDAYNDVRKSAIKAEMETISLGMLNAESIKLEATKTKTGQQVITEKPLRTVADMTGEMEAHLTELPKYTAYAKMLDEKDIWRGKLETLKLPFNMWERHGPVMFISLMYPEIWKERIWIEEQLQRRQTNWRPAVIQLPYISPAKPVVKKKQEEEPPPTRY